MRAVLTKNPAPTQPRNLTQVLDRLEESAEGEEKVTIDAMLDSVGRRSFGPLILVPGLIAMSPLSGIPTLPSILGVIVVLIAGQMLIGKEHFWLPQKALNRKIEKKAFTKGIRALRPVGRFVDRLLQPRLTFLTKNIGNKLVALVCIVVGATMPPLEILPFLATTAGAALTLFSLALIANDGLLALLGYCFVGSMTALAVVHFLG